MAKVQWPFREPGNVDQFPAGGVGEADPFGGTPEGGLVPGTGGGKVPPPRDPPDDE